MTPRPLTARNLTILGLTAGTWHYVTDSADGAIRIAIHHPRAVVLLSVCATLQRHQRCTLTTYQEHFCAGGTSIVRVRAVCHAASTMRFRGTIHLGPAARGATATVDSKALLIGSRAHADLAPILEVVPHDVTCSHGAAVAPLAPAALMALRLRGMTPQRARAMLTTAFLREAMSAPPQKCPT